MKVTIVGAGNVGATCADVISYRGIASEVCLLDIKEGFAEGKALDIMQCASWWCLQRHYPPYRDERPD